MTPIEEIARELNVRAGKRNIGRLADIRKSLPGRRTTRRELFPDSNVKTEGRYAFHHGGRKELQFNIAFEEFQGEVLFRHCVAFSLESSQYFHPEDVRSNLFPKITRFNDFVAERADDFSDMRMWHWDGPVRSEIRPISPIPKESMKVGYFIAIGKLQKPESIDYELILNDLDRLLPMYEYVEGGESVGEVLSTETPDFRFASGHHPGKKKATAIWTTGTKEVTLRHNELQTRLFESLASLHGKDNVGTELIAGRRKRIDLVVEARNCYTLYELKTSSCVESCIRDALAQLIEYSYWVRKAGKDVHELVILSENKLTDSAQAYMRYLKANIGIPISYQRIKDSGELVEG